MKKLKIYIGCSLTQATSEFREQIFNLGDKLNQDFEVLKFLSWRTEPGVKSVETKLNIYEFDMSRIEDCDIFVPIIDLPSVGLGMEFAKAFELKKKIRAFCKKGVRYSAIISTGLETNQQPAIQEYENIDEIVNSIKREFL